MISYGVYSLEVKPFVVTEVSAVRIRINTPHGTVAQG